MQWRILARLACYSCRLAGLAAEESGVLIRRGISRSHLCNGRDGIPIFHPHPWPTTVLLRLVLRQFLRIVGS